MQPPPNLPTAPTPNCLPGTAILTSRQVCQIHFAAPQRAVICPGPSFAGASLSGKRHHKTTHWMNGDFQNRTFLLKRTTMPAMCSKLWSTIILKKHRLYQKRAKNIAWGGVHALHDLQVRGDCLELLFLIYIRALALVEHHPSFRPEFLPRPTVSYLYHISQTDCIVFVIDKWEWVDFLGFSRC